MSKELLYHYNDTIKYVETTEPDKVAEYIDQLQQENKQLKIDLDYQKKITADKAVEADKYIDFLNDEIIKLKKELANWKDGTMICHYEKQLAEKDKEIEKLKLKLEENENIIDFHMKNNIYNVALKDYSVLAPYPKNMAQIIRHEICEKIRAYFEVNPDVVEWDYLNEILNQIEQGEK